MEIQLSNEVTDQQVLNWIRQVGIDVDIEESDFGTPFTDLGVDSLSLFEIVDMIEENTGLVISDSDFRQLNSITAMGQYIREQLNS